MCFHCYIWNVFFFGGDPPVRSKHFRPLTKRMVSRPALGTVFCQARKVSQAFHQAEMRSENVEPGKRFGMSFFESFWSELYDLICRCFIWSIWVFRVVGFTSWIKHEWNPCWVQKASCQKADVSVEHFFLICATFLLPQIWWGTAWVAGDVLFSPQKSPRLPNFNPPPKKRKINPPEPWKKLGIFGGLYYLGVLLGQLWCHNVAFFWFSLCEQCLGFKGDEILPSYIGIMISQYQDPY